MAKPITSPADSIWEERTAAAVDYPGADAQYRADVLRKLYDNAVHRGDPGVTAGETVNAEDLPQGQGAMVSIPGHERPAPTLPSSESLRSYLHDKSENLEAGGQYGGWEWPPVPDREAQEVEGKPRYYHDISLYHPDPWEAAGAALAGDQHSVYDLSGDWNPHGDPSSVYTNQYFNDQIAKGGSRLGQSYSDHQKGEGARSFRGEVPQPGSLYHGSSGGLSAPATPTTRAASPAHRSTPAARPPLRRRTPKKLVTAADLRAEPVHLGMAFAGPAQLPEGLVPGTPAGGSHGAQFYHDPSGTTFVVKKSPSHAPYLADLDVAASAIQEKSGLDTPMTWKHDFGAGPASVQYSFPGIKPAFPGHQVNIDKLSDDDLLTLQKNHALDWMIGNHDAHPGQFFRTPEGKLIGLDRGQAFKFFDKDKLHWHYWPNTVESEPIYNTLYQNMAKGGRQLFDPRQGELAQFIQQLQAIPDDQYVKLLTPYVQGAAKGGELAGGDVDQFLKAAVARKNNLSKDFGTLYDKALAYRSTGMKVASSDSTAIHADGKLTITHNGVSESFTAKKAPSFLVVRSGNPHTKSGLSYTQHASYDAALKARNARGEGHVVQVKQSAQTRTAGYNIHLKLNDGTTQTYSSDIYHRARALADQIAGKSGLEIREKARSPEQVGEGTQYMPVYRNGDWAGNIIIERSDNQPLDALAGPHASQYAYAKVASPFENSEVDLWWDRGQFSPDWDLITSTPDGQRREIPTERVGRIAARPDMHQAVDITDEWAAQGKDLGSHHGTRVFRDPQGEWLFKKPNRGNEFIVPLDAATAQLQHMVGLPAAETYGMPLKNFLVSAVKVFPGAQQTWKKPPHITDLSPQDLMTVQKHHAIDWLLANHDAHVGNWLTTPDHGLVQVDKGQALKYFGQDRLGWDFHPNFYAREPIYNNLYREYANNAPGELNDPREGELGDFIQQVQSIPDDKYRHLFRPFAYAAAHAGMLGTGAYGSPGPADPQRGLMKPTIPPNDPETFLDAMVQRKHNLMNEMGAYFDKASVARAASAMGGQPQAQPSQPQAFFDYPVPPMSPYSSNPKPPPFGKPRRHRWG